MHGNELRIGKLEWEGCLAEFAACGPVLMTALLLPKRNVLWKFKKLAKHANTCLSVSAKNEYVLPG